MRILETIFAGLFGLAFGSFLNVCLSRWPEGESIVSPRSHCRHCSHTLAWWENLPLVSWLALRGRCRSCRSWIGWRYPLVEFFLAALWSAVSWQYLSFSTSDVFLRTDTFVFFVLKKMIFCWLLVALAALDAENLWLPDWLTLPGIALGFVFDLSVILPYAFSVPDHSVEIIKSVGNNAISSLLQILAAAGLILLIRWLYKLLRHREGIGLGDAKLMALLAAWLGLPGALLAFFLGVILGAVVALLQLTRSSTRTNAQEWALSKLPLGTFLCIGGIVSALWGEGIIAAYLRWADL